MVLPDGTAKGMKLVLQERGVDVKQLNAQKMHEKWSILKIFPDKQHYIVKEIQC